MPGLYRDQGVVLRTIKLGEADRIVTIFGQGQGKVRAVAKGVRKPTSKFGARLDPTAHVAFQCYRGRELDVVTQVETVAAHRPLRERYDLLTHASAMLEAVDHATLEREPDPGMHRMLTGALDELARRPSPLVAAAFLWKLLAHVGLHPMLDACARCGDSEIDLVAFDLVEGGVICSRCSLGGGRPISPGALALVRLVLGGGLREALDASGPVVREVERLAVAATEHHLERRLRSAALL